MVQRITTGLSAALGLIALPPVAAAQEELPIKGMAEDWQLNLQQAYSPVMEQLHGLHNVLLPIIIGISVFVLALLVWTCYRFAAHRNPEPSKRTHNTLLEVAWTAVPVLILVVIAVPSFKSLYYMDKAVDPEMTIKAIGWQWAWSYEYPDHGNFAFDAFMVEDDDLKPGQPRLLQTDYEVVVPVETDIRLLVTARDVLHSWAMPSLGVKMDAVPGRLNETWFRIDEPGLYYGQCSEICGVRHGYMPITIRAVAKDRYDAWANEAEQAYNDTGDIAPAYAVLERGASTELARNNIQ